jgi:hypothetical protein
MPHGASCRGILAGQPHAGRGVPGGAALLCPAASCRRAATRRRTTHACRVLARASCPRVPPALFRDGGEAYTPADEPNVRGCQPSRWLSLEFSACEICPQFHQIEKALKSEYRAI